MSALPFTMDLPDSFEAFEKILDSVEPQEEVLVFDRLVKSNSTFVN